MHPHQAHPSSTVSRPPVGPVPWRVWPQARPERAIVVVAQTAHEAKLAARLELGEQAEPFHSLICCQEPEATGA
jgi:hypothetical protein